MQKERELKTVNNLDKAEEPLVCKHKNKTSNQNETANGIKSDARIKEVKENIERWLHELSIAQDIGGMIYCEKKINKLKEELNGLSKQHCT